MTNNKQANVSGGQIALLNMSVDLSLMLIKQHCEVDENGIPVQSAGALRKWREIPHWYAQDAPSIQNQYPIYALG